MPDALVAPCTKARDEKVMLHWLSLDIACSENFSEEEPRLLTLCTDARRLCLGESPFYGIEYIGLIIHLVGMNSSAEIFKQ